MFPVSALEGEPIAGSGAGPPHRAGGQFEHRMGAQAKGDAPGGQVFADLQDSMGTAHEDHVNGEFHAEGVDGFARSDPESLAVGQVVTAEQAGTALAAGGGDLGALGEDGVPGQV